MIEEKSQVLKDTSASGRVRPWEVYKLANAYMSYAYEEVNPKKAERLKGCATWLTYCRDNSIGRLKLTRANFCRVRLCPVCQWRRSLKLYGQMLKILTALGDEYQYIFLTLTVKNCPGIELSGTITHMMESFNRYIGYNRFEKAVKGFYRGFEVTHNLDPTSKDYDTYHPHIHVLLAVRPSYFTSRDYIKQSEWCTMWQKAAQLPYIPSVDVKKVKPGFGKDLMHAISECAKYTVKSKDVINYDDWQLTIDTVRILDKALDNRRFIAFGGVLKEMHKKLNLDDSDTGDLIDIGQSGDTMSADEIDEVTYVWHTGYNQYRLSE